MHIYIYIDQYEFYMQSVRIQSVAGTMLLALKDLPNHLVKDRIIITFIYMYVIRGKQTQRISG